MCGGSKGQTQSQQTSTTSATPEAMAAYRDILSRAQDVAATPYQAYEGERVAGFTPYQEQAFGQIAGAQGAGMGTLGEAGELARRGAAQITAEDIQRGMDPYQQQVIQTTMDEMARQNQIEQSRLQGQAISAGAFGGDRAGIAASELAKRQGDVRAATLSSLLSQGYGRAVAQAQADRLASQAGAGQLAGLAQQEFAMPLAQANALYGAGAAQQGLAQQQLNVPYQTYLEQRAYPYQQAQWLAGLATGVGGAMGGTTQAQGTQTPAQPNPSNAILGGGLSLAMLPVSGGGSLGGNLISSLPFLSDERAKDNIVPVGKLNDGQTVYKYNYKGEPGTHLGLLAQEVEKAHPEAVGEVGGLKMVNYDAATKDAVPHKADGGGLSIPMDGQAVLPYSQGFIPKAMPMRALQAPQASLQMPGEAPDQSKQFVAQAMDLAKSIRDNRKAEMPSAQSWASGTTITPEPTPEWGYMADGGRVPMRDGGVPVEEARVSPVPFGSDAVGLGLIPSEEMRTNLQAPPSVLKEGIQAVPPRPSEVAQLSGPAVKPSGPTPVELQPFELARVVGDTPGLTAGTAYQPPPMAPPMGLRAKDVAPPAPEPKGGFELSPEARQAMMQAGFALMASRSPFLGQAIGEAGMTGVQAYGEAQKVAEARKLQREKLEQGNWQILPDVRTELNQPILYNRKHGQALNAITREPLSPDTKLISDKGDRLGFLYEKMERDAARREAERKPTRYVTADGMPVRQDIAGNLYDPANNKLSEAQIMTSAEFQAKKKSAEKKEETFRRVANIYNTNRMKYFSIAADVDHLDPKINNLTAGAGRNIPLKNIKGTDARNVEEILEKLRSQLQLGALQELKTYSTTGASGLGSTTQNEIKLLGDQFAKLSADLSPEELKKQFGELKRLLAATEAGLRGDIEANFADVKDFEKTLSRLDKGYETYRKGEYKAGRGVMPIPTRRDGTFDTDKMVPGQVYTHKGKVGTWTGTGLIPLE